MPRILVNCHGGRVTGPDVHPPQFIVPEGVYIHFYVNDGQELEDGTAWQILNHRRQFLDGDPPETLTVGPGELCDNYYGLPYNALEVINGVQRESVGQNGQPLFESILETGPGQSWGNPVPNTIQPQQVMLPPPKGGAPYARSVITLSNVASCPGITNVDWISCRAHW